MRKSTLFILLNLIIISSSLLGCSNNKESKDELPDYGLFTEDDYLKTDGSLVRNMRGTGDEIYLRGTNAGGYLVIEQWMTAISGDEVCGYYDHKKVTDVFMNRFGYENTLDLWEYYRDNYWTENDFINCYNMQMNVIRLPFSYMSVDPDYNNVRRIDDNKYNFEILDSFIEGAGRNGLYVILDMHGAYGSQNGQDHSGEALNKDQVDFYSNEDKMTKTIALWKAISNRYKDNPVVAGYDLLNEPGVKAGLTSKRHWDFLDRCYDVIRDNNDQHIVIFESCWDGAHLPKPEEYGWLNCMYSFHNYSGESDADKNLMSMLNKINGVKERGFNVPFYMGEFNCYGTEKSWDLTLSLFNGLKWHWTSWTYKLNRTNDGAYPGWGIYYSTADLVKPAMDSIEEIKEKWSRIDTGHETAVEMRFKSLHTLSSLMARYCGEKIKEEGEKL